MKYKVFLDDERQPPSNDWVCFKWPQDVILFLQTFHGSVETISLDHDLGNDEIGTGYDVLTWLESKVFENPSYPVPEILVHSANSSARVKMELAIQSIMRLKGHAL
jgi:hypothetical protein